MNKFLIGILLPYIAVSLTGCSASGEVLVKPQKLTGIVMTVGNDPFVKLALRTEDGKVYIISGGRQIVRSLSSYQGRIVDLFFDGVEKGDYGDELRVVRFALHEGRIQKKGDHYEN